MKILLVLCFVAAAWAKEKSSAPVAHSLFPGFGYPFLPGGFRPIGPPIYPRPPVYPPQGGFVCPNYPPTPLTGCRLQCYDDHDCQGGKCCNYGCSSVCVRPPTPAPAPTTTAGPTTTTAPTTTTTTAPTTTTTAAPTTTTTAAPTTTTTAAPTTTTAPPTPAPQPLCPAGPSDTYCRQQCRYPCFGSSCNHCVVRCYTNYDCPGNRICCQDNGCNMLCTDPIMS